VNQPPLVSAGHRIAVPAPEETNAGRTFQVFQGGWIPLEFSHVKLDSAAVLLTAENQILLEDSLRFEDQPGEFFIKGNRHCRRHREQQQQCKPLLPLVRYD